MQSEHNTEECKACGLAWESDVSHFTCSDARDENYTYRICPQCGLATLNPFPSIDQMRAIYSQDYYGLGSTKFSPLIETCHTFSMHMRARIIQARVNAQTGRILDVGCGSGSFLNRLAQAGFEIYGTEIDGTAYERALRVNGIHLKLGELSTGMFEENFFDAATLWHVLEHVPDPLKTLETLRKMLKPNGHLVIEVPNFSSIQANLFGRHWFHLDPPRHFYQFTEESLTHLVERAGFSVSARSTLSWQMGGFGYLQSALNTCIRPRELFYDMLRTRNRCEGHSAAKLASVMGGALATPIAAVGTLLEAIARRGSVLRYVCHSGQPLT